MRTNKTVLSLLLSGFLGLLIVTACGLTGLYWHLQRWQSTPLQVEHEQLITLAKGQGLKAFAGDLEAAGLISDQRWFRLWVRLQHNYAHVQAGTYRFQGSVTPHSIMTDVLNGSIYRVLTLEVTVPEGFTLEQINTRLAELQVASLPELQKLSAQQPLLESLAITAPTLEGFLFPATYRFFDKVPSPETVYAQMVQEFHSRLPPHYLKSCESHGLSLLEAVTFASLIEKETALAEEKPLVAEVIWNRLKERMPLGIDAAIIHGIKNYQGKLTTKHLRDPSNPYNTRIHRGLPPGPIGAPGLASLRAVFTPSQQGYYYYVLLPDQKNRHHFSKTLQEHNSYVKKLVRAQKSASK